MVFKVGGVIGRVAVVALENLFCLFGKISVGVENWFHLSIPQVWWFFSDLRRRLWMPRFVVDREDCFSGDVGVG